MALIDQSEGLEGVLRSRIKRSGPMPFSEFMNECLYHPSFGYYCRSLDRVGRSGDFVTSVSTGDLFGSLLCERFVAWSSEWEIGKTRDVVTWIEAGAHDGRLALDILNHCRDQFPTVYERVRYLILEPSDYRRSQQARLLAGHGDHVKWSSDWESLPDETVSGVLFSNELLDAMPVERLFWDANQQEWRLGGVTWEDQSFKWVLFDGPAPPEVQAFTESLPIELRRVLPSGYATELGSEAKRWWSAAAKRLHRGHLMAIDYGSTREQLLSPHRAQGTLRAYSQHHQNPDLFASPGEQDLTAHVDFSAIQEAGLAAGLSTLHFQAQGVFFTETLKMIQQRDPASNLLGPLRRQQWQALTHPSHFGRSFSVLVQERR